MPNADLIAGDAHEFHSRLCGFMTVGHPNPLSITPHANWEERGVCYNKDMDCFLIHAPSLEEYLVRKHGLAKRGA
eukprot:2658259-Rhodomonas_salina.1